MLHQFSRMPGKFKSLGPRNRHLTRLDPITESPISLHILCFPLRCRSWRSARAYFIPSSATISFCPHSPPFVSFSPVFSASLPYTNSAPCIRATSEEERERGRGRVITGWYWCSDVENRGGRREECVASIVAYPGSLPECYILNVILHESLSPSRYVITNVQ